MMLKDERVDIGGAVLVTGAASGIGRACVEDLVRRSVPVVGVDRNPATLLTLEKDLGSSGLVSTLEVDLADVAAFRGAMSEVNLPDISGFVHCAGVVGTATLRDLGEAEYDRVVGINQRAAFFALQIVAEMMLSGSIVLISSVAARGPRVHQPHYAASKAALISLMASAAATYGPALRVNAVCPGVIETPMYRQLAQERSDALGTELEDPYAELLKRLPIGRIGRAEEVASVVSFLLSGASSYVTGQAINVCGGMVNS